MSLRGTPSSPNHRAEKPARTNNMPAVKNGSTTKVVIMTDTTLVSSLEAQLTQAQSDLAQAQSALAVAQAQNVADAATIAALNAQVISLQAQVVALQTYINGLGLDKIAQFKMIKSYVQSGGGIYVPPSYDNPVVNYTPVFKLSIKTLPAYTISGGGFP